jgi:hypothetical protein
LGRRTPGFRRPSSASAERSGDGQVKKPPFKGNIPKNEIPHIQFSRECQEPVQPAISFEAISPQS